MDKEATKKFVENNGFICNKCGKVIVDGHKHKNEEDLCDQCKIAHLQTKLAESDEYREVLLEEKAGYIDLISGYADKCKELEQQLKEERKKVCDFLRQALDIREHHPIVSIELVSQEWFFHKLLNQIERGEL